MQQAATAIALRTRSAECKRKSRFQWRAVESGVILRTLGTDASSAPVGTPRKIGIVMIVTALLAPVDHRRKIILLAIFAFIALC
ncbi:MAG: hypothetical protein ACK5WD_03595 [bacterium]